MIGRIALASLAALALAGPAHAVTEESFALRTGADLLALCAAPPGDRLHAAAIHACHAYALGAFHYYETWAAGHPALAYVCVAEPRPSRDRLTAEFVTWGRANPQLMAERPVDVLFRFLSQRFPCQR
jgi:hypothetical protein